MLYAILLYAICYNTKCYSQKKQRELAIVPSLIFLNNESIAHYVKEITNSARTLLLTALFTVQQVLYLDLVGSIKKCGRLY